MSGKKLAAARAKINREHLYQPIDAVRLLKELETAKFDETVEVHFRLGTVMLPHGTGSDARVIVFAQGEKAAEAEAAGAEIVGGDELAQRILDGFDDFDVAVATPDMMVVVGKLGRVLGPSGKMPNPKTGTVTMDVKKAVEEIKSGKIEYRTDRTGIVHVPLGKKSFGERELGENYAMVLEEILRAKPASTKGRYIKSVVLSSTMGPGIKIDPSRTRDVLEETTA